MSNPFVGPRAYFDGEKLYGRGDEGSRLYFLLLAERIVLLYSPSGAGKTSLLHAQLAPRLRDEGFRVFKNIRLNKVSPEPIANPVNRYALATILSLEDELPRERKLDCATVGAMALGDYFKHLEQREREDKKPLVLIFDAFEEIFTLHPADYDAKKEFFAALGEILKQRDVWAVFAMREEFIARLDEYEHLIPSRVQSRLRLSLLTREQAVEAMRKSAGDQDVEFSAAPKLSVDLSRIQIQNADGTFERVPGRYVEPVVLQVVCRTLWRKMRRKKNEISEDDLAGLDVDNALAIYYANCIAEIVNLGHVSERTVRDWFSQQLITGRGARRQVMLEEENSAGLPNDVIEQLVDRHHLLRKEERSGRIFYELAHDRLVDPVNNSNIIWARKNLNLVQSSAAEWIASSNPQLLLRDTELVDAMRWRNAHGDEVTSAESSYINQSRSALSELGRAAVDWELSERDPAKLLRGGALKYAQDIARQKGEWDLTTSERAILKTSHAYRRLELREKIFRGISGLVLPLVIVGFLIAGAISEKRKQHELKTARAEGSIAATSEVQRSAEKLVTQNWADQPSLEPKAVAQALDADLRISTLTSTVAADSPRSGTVIQYFVKPTDSPKLSEALKSELRFQEVRLMQSKVAQRTNAIWYGNQVPEEDVRLIAYAVIRAGNELQVVQPLTKAGVPPNVVNVGYNANVADQEPLTTEDITRKSLKELERWPARYLGTSRGKVVELDAATRNGTIEYDGGSVGFRIDSGDFGLAKGDDVEFLLFERTKDSHFAANVHKIDLTTPLTPTETTTVN